MTQLYLIGYRATGKSSLAPLVAGTLGRPAVDLDRLIARIAARTVAEIWATLGEPWFRTQESILLSEHSGLEPAVIATGGGIVLDPGNRNIIRQSGFALWLLASPETIIARMLSDAAGADDRPALRAGLQLEQEVRRSLAEREPLYRELADGVVETDGRPLAELADEILLRFRQASSP